MKIIFFVAGLFVLSGVMAQDSMVGSVSPVKASANGVNKIAKADKKYLANVEDTLEALMDKVLDDEDVVSRLRSDSMVTRTLVRSLKVPYSFNYPFDSVQTLTIAYPADSSFRIFTWQLNIDENVYRQKGAIQMNSADGKLELFPLFDASEYTEFPNDSIRGGNNWIGAIYYKIIQKEYGGQKFYTLLGFDDNGFRSTKKWIDVLTFDENRKPHFGGDYFAFEKGDSSFETGWKRFNIEFKKEGRARMNYDPDKDMIMYDHLISESNEPERKYTFIPDGDYEGLQWKDGHWVHISKVYTEQLTDGKEPQPELLMDENGQVNEAKLAEQSEKNANKKVEAIQIKKKSKVVLPTTKRKGNG